jgi:hypothetical protein
LSARRPSRASLVALQQPAIHLSDPLAAIFNKRLGALLFVCLLVGGCDPPADTQTGWFARRRALQRFDGQARPTA